MARLASMCRLASLEEFRPGMVLAARIVPPASSPGKAQTTVSIAIWAMFPPQIEAVACHAPDRGTPHFSQMNVWHAVSLDWCMRTTASGGTSP